LIENLSDVYQYKEDLKKAIINYKPKFRLILREDLGSNKKSEIERREFK